MKTKIMLFKEFRKIIKDEVITYRLDTRGSKPIYSVNKFIKRYPILIRLNTF